MCSVGILSSCDCTQTSFGEGDLKDYGPKIGTMTARLNGGPVYATVKTGDTISYVCGSAGTGLDYCGARTITLITKKNGIEIQAPFVLFDAGSNQIKLEVVDKSHVGLYEIEVRATLVNFNTMSFTVEIIKVTVTAECLDSLFEPLNLSSTSLLTTVGGAAASLLIEVPKDSSSLVLGDKGGYTYCGDRKLFA